MPELNLPIRAVHGVAVKVLVRSRRAHPPGGLPPVVGPFAAYLDTGASVTVLDPGVIAALRLEPVREAGLHVLGRDDVSFHDLYEVEAALAGCQPPRWVPLIALGGTVNPKGTAAALGRDFLAHLTLVYDGPAGRFVIRW
jgi:hypothetical protein